MKVRGVIHARARHSGNGFLSLAELKKSLFAHGLSFCCVTEESVAMTHETAAAFVDECHQLSDQAFVFIPGFEVPYDDVSLLLIGTSVFMNQTVDELVLRAWREVTPLIFLGRGTAVTEATLNPLLTLIDGVEVWNRSLDSGGSPHFKTLKMFSSLRKIKPELRAVAGLGLYEFGGHTQPEIELTVDAPDTAQIIRQLGLGFYTMTSGRTTIAADGSFISGGGFITKLSGLVGRIGLHMRKYARITTSSP